MRPGAIALAILLAACGGDAAPDCARAAAHVEALWIKEARAAGKSRVEAYLDPTGTPESGARAWAEIVSLRCERDRWSGWDTNCVRRARTVADANACVPQHE
jgi:hypothetical protein